MWVEFATCLPTDAHDGKYPPPPMYTAAVVQPGPAIMQPEMTVVQPATVIQAQPAVMVVNPVGKCSHHFCFIRGVCSVSAS